MIDWKKESERFIAELPHPLAPSLKVRELPQAVRLATKTKFGGHASFAEAAAFWGEYQQMNAGLVAQGKQPISPDEYGHILDRLAPVSFTYHGRPPNMYEIQQHRDSSPSQVRQYYGDLPDKTYPDITAADMVKYLALADDPARQHIQRSPAKLEARTFAHANMGYDAIVSYYKSLGEQRSSVDQNPTQRDPAATGLPPTGGQSADQRAIRPALGRAGAAASGADGVSQG